MDTERLNDLFLNEDPTVRAQAREMWESLGRPPMAALVGSSFRKRSLSRLVSITETPYIHPHWRPSHTPLQTDRTHHS